MGPLVIARDAELAAVVRMLEGVVEHGPAGLVLWGEAGIGKSTIWRAGVDAARQRGCSVMACRPTAAELRLSYSGLVDVVAGVDPAWFAGLAVPQRRAMDAALLHAGDGDVRPDQRAVAAALLSVLNRVADASPVLVAIDDAQWLDGPSQRVLGYALRRCRGPIAVLATERATNAPLCSHWLSTPDTTRFGNVRVGALSIGALHLVLCQATGRSFARPTMVRIAEVSAGNPFYAVELARSLDGRLAASSWTSVTAEQLVDERLAGLHSSVRDALLVASAAAAPTPGLLRGAMGLDDVTDLVSSMEDSGLVELVGGRVRFTHPLWANAVYRKAGSGRRRALHRRLSELVDDVEERARHLALSTIEPDGKVIDALDEAAHHARRRGAVSAAAELAELALELGANSPDRRINVARDHFDSDDPARARELLAAVIDEIGPGSQRAEALCLLGTIVYESDDFGRSVEILEQAYAEAGDDTGTRCRVAAEASFALAHSGNLAAATAHLALAVDEAAEIGDDGLLAELLAGWVTLRVMQGEEIDVICLERAMALEDVDRPSHALMWPSFNAAVLRAWRHDAEGARDALAEVYLRCVERGAESDLWLVLGMAMQVALSSGDVASAQAFATEMAERARMTASTSIQALAAGSEGIITAWRGDVDLARRVLPPALATLAPSRFATPALYALAALGAAELSVGGHAAAAEWLAPAAALLTTLGIGDPEVVPLGPDAAEALIALGRVDEAAPIVELLERTGQRPGRDWAYAVGARCRGLLLTASGDLDAAAAAYADALEAHRRLPLLSYEQGRTLLALGQLQRRRGERRAAHASLQQAAEHFDESGAARWALRARADLERLGLHPGNTDQLTPTEARVAELAAAGHTNREVASMLFVSAKTVEAHLARVYRKLGIRSRAELGRMIAAGAPAIRESSPM